MKKLFFLLSLIITLLIVVLFTRDESPNWVHQSFHGTVVATSEDNTLITVLISSSNSEKVFSIADYTLYTVDYQIGDMVIIESDYDTNSHNGVDIPYPAIMITNPDIHDGK